jgi:TatD DNase family protein
MNTDFFDIHSHLNLDPLYTDREAVLARMREQKTGSITVGVDFEMSKRAIDLAHQYPDVLWATAGMHPCDNVDEVFDYEEYLALARDEKVVAIGECGLDYFRLPEHAETQEVTIIRQKGIFKQHIELAREVGKPLMIHARPSKGSMDAYEDVLDILEEQLTHAVSKVHVNFHFFVGNSTIANRIVKNGWSVSYDGPITFSHDYDAVIASIPLEHLMCETDAPFAAPVPYRGKTCEPWMVNEVYKRIAEIKNVPVEEVVSTIRANVTRVFGV